MLWSEAQRTVRSLVPFDGTLRFKMLIACWLPIFTGKQHDNDTYHVRMGKVLMYNEKMAGEQDGLNSTCYPEKVNIRRRWSALSSHCSLPTLVRRIETSFQDPPDPGGSKICCPNTPPPPMMGNPNASQKTQFWAGCSGDFWVTGACGIRDQWHELSCGFLSMS